MVGCDTEQLLYQLHQSEASLRGQKPEDFYHLLKTVGKPYVVCVGIFTGFQMTEQFLPHC